MSGTIGATRNRTERFLKYRTQAHGSSTAAGLIPSNKQVDKGTSKLLEAALASNAENGGSGPTDQQSAAVASMLSPQYVEFKEQIRTEMFTIKQKMNELRASHGKATLTSFDDSNSHDVEIEVLTQEITRLFRKCEVRLQRFGQGPSNSEADEKVKHNVQRTLAIELQRLSVQFRKQQKAYLSRLRQKDAPSASGASFSVLDETSGTSGREAIDPDYDPGFNEIQVASDAMRKASTNRLLNHVQTMKVDTMEMFAEERDREVRNILQSINDLAQIMKDLSVLVIDQGTILDRIDYNMEQVATKVDEGVKQLVKAEQIQKSSRTVICIMFLLVAVIVMVIIVLFKLIVF